MQLCRSWHLDPASPQVGCFAWVLDSYGAAGQASSSVRVVLKTYTLSELSAMAEDMVAIAINSGNANAAKQVLAAAASAAGSTRGARLRRELQSQDETSGEPLEEPLGLVRNLPTQSAAPTKAPTKAPTRVPTAGPT